MAHGNALADIFETPVGCNVRQEARSLYRRLNRLHIQHFPPLYAGPDAIEKYETEFKAILNAIKSRERLARLILPSMANRSGVSVEDLAERLGIQVRSMREKPNRVLSITEAASILHVRKSAVIAWVRDLELLKADKRGGIQLQELRRFVTSESRWLLPVAKNISARHPDEYTLDTYKV